MPKFDKETYQLNKRKIRLLLHKYPNVSSREAGKTLDIHYHTANKLIKEVKKEMSQELAREISKIKSKSIYREIIETQNALKVCVYHLWLIVDNKNTTFSDKIKAIRIISNLQLKLLEIKLGTEIYTKGTKDLGINVPEIVRIVKSITHEEKKMPDLH